MKKYYYSLFAAAAMLLATSCSQEEEVVQADNGVAKFSVSLQGATGSRAAGDGTQVDELIYEVYENGTNVYEGKEEVSAGKADVNIPLLRGHEYQIVFWAQNSEAGIYDAENLKAISVDYEKVTANNEAYDAFYNAITYTVEAGVTTVELTRPFAQLNVATTTADWEQAKDLLNDADPANKAQVTVNGLATTFDASTGTTSGDANVTFQAATFNGETLTLNETEYKVLAMNYLLVPGTKEEAKTTTTVGVALMNNESTALSFEVPNVPIQRNYRTNIVGNLFTQNGGFEVIVKPGFGEPDNNYPEIALAAKLGGTVILEGDVTLDDVMVVEKDLIINLNGNNLEGTKNDILFRVNDGATLTINGDGKVETKLYAASANAGGTIIVNGGEYICGTTCFQANGGKVYIKDGTFSVTSDDKKYILNHIDAQKDNGLIEVTGGTFYGFNPAASNSEYPAMDFVAYGYTVAYDAATDTYTVVENPLEQAVLAGETEITLTEDVTLHKSFVLEAGKQLTIDLAGKSIINTSNSEEFGEGEAIIAYGKLTLEGEGTVQANSMAVWARGTEGAEITINGGTYIGMADGLAKGGRSVIYASSGNTINIYGGTFEALTIDETSYADDLYAVLNVADNNGTINVYGGSFKNFNPKQPGTEPASWNSEHPNGFVVDGYSSIKNEDWYYVTKTVNSENIRSEISDTEIVEITLSENVNISEETAPFLHIYSEKEISTNNFTLTTGNSSNYGLFCNKGSDVTFNNANIISNGGGIVARDGAQVEFNSGSVKIQSTSTSQRYVFYAYGDGTVVTINGGDFSFEQYKKRAYAYVFDNAILYIKGGNFGFKSNHPSDPTKPLIADGGTIIITGGTFGFDPSQWVADGYTATKSGSTWTVTAE